MKAKVDTLGGVPLGEAECGGRTGRAAQRTEEENGVARREVLEGAAPALTMGRRVGEGSG